MKIRICRESLLEHKKAWSQLATEINNMSDDDFIEECYSGKFEESLEEIQLACGIFKSMLALGSMGVDLNKLELEQKKIVAVVGKSGCGKSSITRQVCENLEGINIIKSKTTRKMRESDPEDRNTHLFVSEGVWNKEKAKAVAVYNSPKGYHSWISPDMIKSGVVNIYAIDPVAVEQQLIPYCKQHSILLEVVYIDINENLRKTRISQRGCDTKAYDAELHLGKHNLKHPHWVILNNGTMEEAVKELTDIVEELKNGSNTRK